MPWIGIAMLTIEMAIADMTKKNAWFRRIWFQNMLEPTVGPFETGLAAWLLNQRCHPAELLNVLDIPAA